MDPVAWNRLQSAFFSALKLPPHQRAAFFDEVSGEDAAFRKELEAVLAAHDRATTSPMIPLSGAEPEEAAPGGALEGRQLGRYLLRERIGRGGMGEVYRAERVDDQYRQTVAVKLLRSGLPADEMARRFRIERQVLARLQHPHVAPLLDGGVSEDGVPYLVMQYVDGSPITEYADRNRSSVAERMRLFATVCRTVHFAHSNLVVHRDLKPSNIFVGSDGEVRLLDFGIAKLLDPEGMGVTASLTEELLLLTPEHAAPEQILGDAVTTATDVYALGVLLYELLTGTRPFRASLGSGWHRAVCEQEPVRPSAALTTLSTLGDLDASRVAEQRGLRPAALRQTLHGDLDHIVLMALRKEPERRYASAEQFAEDVERYLERRPVLARRDTLGYRTGKFVRRNRTAVTAATAAVLALITGLTFAVAGQIRARDAERIALEEAATASQVSEFLVQLFQASDPGESRGENLTARELLDRGARRIEEQLDDQPVVRARLLRTMGKAYAELGLFDPALRLFEQELVLQQARFGEGSVEVARSRDELASIHASRGDYLLARDIARQTVASLERSRLPDDPELLRALNTLARTYSLLGEYGEARLVLERVVAIRERTQGPEHIDLYSPLNNLAIMHWQLGGFETARALFERALAIVEREHGADHPSVAHTLNNLALVHRGAGDRAQAIAAHERALAIRRKLLDPAHPDISESLNNLGVVYLHAKEFREARERFAAALGIRERALGPEHAHTASSQSNLGFALLGLGEHAAAASHFERALASLQRSVGAGHTMTSHPLWGLARIDAARGAHGAAERRFREVIAIREAALGSQHPDLAEPLRDYVELLRTLGRTTEADSLESRMRLIR